MSTLPKQWENLFKFIVSTRGVYNIIPACSKQLIWTLNIQITRGVDGYNNKTDVRKNRPESSYDFAEQIKINHSQL